MLKFNNILIACAFIVLSISSSSLYAISSKPLTDVSVTNAIVYVPLGASRDTVAFFTISNNSARPVSILKVTSKAIKKIILVPALPTAVDAVNPWLISAHQTLALNPANQYLQLTGLKNSLSTGDELQLEVSLSNGKKLVLIVRAKSAYDQIHSH